VRLVFKTWWAQLVAAGILVDDYSTDGTTLGAKGDGVFRLVAALDPVTAAPGTAHAWAVGTIVGGLGQWCVDFDSAVGPSSGSVWWSKAVGFTGGSLTARPTAADELEITTGSNVFHTVNGAYDWHTIRVTTAGQESLRCVFRVSTAPAGPSTIISVERPATELAAWAVPDRAMAVWRSGAGSFGNRADWTATTGWRAWIGGVARTLIADTLAPQAALDADGDRLLEPTGLTNTTIGDVGYVPDWFWCDDSVPDVSTFSGPTGERQWIAYDEMVQPYGGPSLGAANIAGAKLRWLFEAGAEPEPAPAPIPVVPFEYDPTRGNIGLVGPATVLLHLSEPDGVQPSDAAGNLDDLAGYTGIAPPASTVAAWTGRGRLFTVDTGLVAADKPDRDTLLTRDVSIQVIAALHLDAGFDTGTIYVRGAGGSPPEWRAIGLDAQATGNQVSLRMYWQDSVGVFLDQDVGTYEHPGDDAFVLLTATRRWESTTRVVIRYYIGETLLAEHESADGDITGATVGTTAIGGHPTGGVWTRQFLGIIDELKVVDYEMSHEEIRAAWRRMHVYQPAGLDMLRGLLPPGVSWYRDPSSRIARLVRIAGQAFGYAMAMTEELRASWLPGSAYREHLARWERLRGVSARARDSLDDRRARVVALFRREHGYSRPAIQVALAELFDQAADDVEILEFSNVTVDDFATIDAMRWYQPDTAAGAAWAVSGGAAVMTATAGIDLRANPPRILMSVDGGGDFAAVAAIREIPDIEPGVVYGIVLASYPHGQSLTVGVRDTGAGFELAYHRGWGGVGAIATLAAIDPSYAANEPIWIRVQAIGDGMFSAGYSLTGPTFGFTDAWIVSGLDAFDPFAQFHWAGLGVATVAAAPVSAQEVHFDAFLARDPTGDRPYQWYVFRDPLLPGSPDIVGARATVLRLKPAHTHAAAIAGLNVLCDDPATVCDREPLGGI
jgi:hypothetical protein